MRYLSFFKVILSGFIVLFLAASCVKEGPMGLPGADGSDGQDGLDGMDGNVSCLACHNSNTIETIQGQFAMSVHSAGAIAVDYAGSRASCSPCHSHEQFVQFAELGQVHGNITNPTAWKCNTCHGLHETFEVDDYALRLSEPVVGIFDKSTVLDMIGSSNLCANCHQSRSNEPLAADPSAETFTMTIRTGPHYGPQSNLVAGVGFAEIEGSVAYPAPNSSYHLNDQTSCTGCHMGEFSEGRGGHSWIPNLNACNTCHETEDYNYGGTQSDVAAKLDQIKEKLYELGVMTVNEESEYSVVPGSYPMVLARAYFNWKGIKDDRSLGVHNPRYINALLINTLEALDAYEPAPEV